ncbi:MAG: thiamine-phosphate kinase [Victivallaceae bacterium]|nr:thiamine-phosphate kinase [Victivallaceae bacterium]
MNELELVEKIAAMMPAGQDVTLGIGDDAAAIDIGGTLLLAAADQIVSNVHFDFNSTPAGTAGEKLLKRNLSDIAAMGGVPRWALVTLAADTDPEWILEFHRGLAFSARQYGVAVIGGDLAKCFAPGAVGSLTILGTAEPDKLCLRGNAKPGDAIFATGKFGRSFPTGHHLSFEPRLAEAAFLAGNWTRAMMDVSDGPALDARRFAAASNVRFSLDPERFPARDGATVSERLGDGEDYELIFTVPEEKRAELTAAWPFATGLTEVGKVLPGSGVTGPGEKELEDYGYRHFKEN